MRDTAAEVSLVVLFGALCAGVLSPGVALIGVFVAIVAHVLLDGGDGPPAAGVA